MHETHSLQCKSALFIHILKRKITENIASKQNINAKSHNFFERETFFLEARLRKTKIVVFLQFEI